MLSLRTNKRRQISGLIARSTARILIDFIWLVPRLPRAYPCASHHYTPRIWLLSDEAARYWSKP